MGAAARTGGETESVSFLGTARGGYVQVLLFAREVLKSDRKETGRVCERGGKRGDELN